jgi:hypothetical protein
MIASRVNDSKDLRERAAEMRASSKQLKDNNTATVILRLAELYDRLAERAESRSKVACRQVLELTAALFRETNPAPLKQALALSG